MKGKVTAVGKPKQSKQGRWYALVEIDGQNNTLFGDTESALNTLLSSINEGGEIEVETKDGKMNPIITAIKGSVVEKEYIPRKDEFHEQQKTSGSDIWQEAYKNITDIIGREPKTDGEFASVNSLFIYYTRK